jgi:hypothetical protein
MEVRACGVYPGHVHARLTGFHEHVLLPADTDHEAVGVVVEAGCLGRLVRLRCDNFCYRKWVQ